MCKLHRRAMMPAMTSRGAVTALLGRRSECEKLDRLLADVRGGDSRALVVRGVPGVGKTALLEYLTQLATDCRVVQVAGVESEMELPYAGLQQLCAPFLDRMDGIPAPQRDALGGAFGLTAGPPPDRFLVGLGALYLFAEASERQPLVCVIDDAQWLDQISLQTIVFLARRLMAERIAVVIAVREPSAVPELAQLPELTVDGLGDAESRALLATVVPGRLDSRVRDRIVAETRGNPLAIVALPRAWTIAELADGIGVPGAMPMTGRIENSFFRRLVPLPPDSRQLLLAAAAEPLGDPALLWQAAGLLGIDAAAAVAAEASGLVEFGVRTRFQHPLVRSAVYRAASPEERQAVHRALAHATDVSTDPDRRAWHLASAARGPDEEVAAELERSAGRAQARGGFGAAAAFLRRSVELTQEPARRTERSLAAAQASLTAGALDLTRELLTITQAGVLDPFQRARIELLRAHVAYASGPDNNAAPLLLTAARRLESFDLDLARETYLAAWGAAAQMGSLEAEVLLEVSRAIQALPPPPTAPRPLDLLLDGLALLITDGHAAAAAPLQAAAKVLAALPVEDVLRWGWMAPAACAATWDFEGLYATAARQVQLVRDAGALSQVQLHLAQVGLALTWMGDFAGAAANIAETDSAAAATGIPITPYSLLRLQALQGREDAATAAIVSADEHASAADPGLAAHREQWAAAVLYNGLARYDEAASAARRAASEIVVPFYTMWTLPELVEAAARVGDSELAHVALERLTTATRPYGNDSALGIEARCQALLSTGDTAEALYRDAIQRLGRTRLRPELARAHLLYGEWLRREGRRVDARDQLRTAYDLFTTIGMEAFVERARRELTATGETVRKRTAEVTTALTPQEAQIARLARDGFSNPEIATRLYLSPRTVEWHLRKVFTKLNIRSRQQLHGAALDTTTA
jgi:DNA-binding CsgD family transcriptional regulator